MRESLTVVTRKGQITVPAELRRLWGLKEGDKVAIALPDSPDATVTLRPVRSVTEMTFGALRTNLPAPDLHELRQAYMDEIAEREFIRQQEYHTKRDPREGRRRVAETARASDE
ncbi:MAG TPA: AbrB/MazE/SpoVT family DNA-binding domain-containing protein [Dehalococcoidia bacterium]|nr:AbrB/MazE/SpoVT family DNA-binding domain-containing protein [Dehalococcoidia bacterium]